MDTWLGHLGFSVAFGGRWRVPLWGCASAMPPPGRVGAPGWHLWSPASEESALTHSFTLLHTPSHSFTLLHTPSHSFTLLHTPSHSFTLLHTPSALLHTPFTLLHTPSHSFTLVTRQSAPRSHMSCRGPSFALEGAQPLLQLPGSRGRGACSHFSLRRPLPLLLFRQLAQAPAKLLPNVLKLRAMGPPPSCPPWLLSLRLALTRGLGTPAGRGRAGQRVASSKGCVCAMGERTCRWAGRASVKTASCPGTAVCR